MPDSPDLCGWQISGYGGGGPGVPRGHASTFWNCAVRKLNLQSKSSQIFIAIVSIYNRQISVGLYACSFVMFVQFSVFH